MKLDEKGRCCGRKPIEYRGGSRSVNGPTPMKFCPRCSRQFDPLTGEQCENSSWKKCPGCGNWIDGFSSACGECRCEDDA